MNKSSLTHGCALVLLVSVASAPALRADDYGQWERQQYGMATFLTGVTFVDRDYGWAVGAINGLGPSIHVTTNGGQNWALQTGEMFNMMYLACDASDRENLWVPGIQFIFPGMVMTHDGGAMWETAVMPGFVWSAQDVQAVDAQHVKVPSSWAAFAGGDKDGITITNDGGATWTGYEWGVDTFPRYCSFLDVNRGWMTGGTWPSDASGGFRLSENSQPVPNVPIQVWGRKTRTQDQYEAAIARTVDGGQTWELLVWDTGRFYLNGICMINDNEGWAVGESGYTPFILHTTNGWTDWEFQDTPSGDYGLITVDFVSDREGFAVGFGPQGFDVTMYSLHTMDGGQTWTLDVPGIGTGPLATAFVDRTAGWTVGGNNRQLSTVAHYTNDDGGPFCNGGETIRKAKCKTKNGAVKKIVIKAKALTPFETYTCTLDDGQTDDQVANDKGKATWKFKNHTCGAGTVSIGIGANECASGSFDCGC